MSDVYQALDVSATDPRKDPLSAPAISPTPAKFPAQTGTDYDALIKRQTELSERGEQHALKNLEENSAARRDLMRATADYTRTAQRAGESYRKGLRDTPEFSQPDMSQATNNYMMFAAAMASIAGAFGRYHTTTAFNAFAGAMNGWAQGNLQAFDQNFAKWKAADTAAQRHNEKVTQQYQSIMQDAKLTLDQKAMQVQMVAAANQDQMSYDLMQQRNFTAFAQLIEKKDQTQAKLTESSHRIEVMGMQAQVQLLKLQSAIDKAPKLDTVEGLMAFTQKLYELGQSNDPKQRQVGKMLAGAFNQKYSGGGTAKQTDLGELAEEGREGPEDQEKGGFFKWISDYAKRPQNAPAQPPPAAPTSAGTAAQPSPAAPAAARPAAPPAAAAASPAAALNPRTVNAVVAVNKQMGRDGKSPQRALRLSQNNRAIAEFRSLPPGTWVLNPSDGKPIQVPGGGPTETMAGP